MNGSPPLAEVCGWTLVRTVILCLLAWPLGVGIERWLRGVEDVKRPYALAALLAPFLFPELLVGYSYRNAALAYPKSAEFLCACLLFIRIVPVGVVALLASPATVVSSSAIHCRRMLFRSNSSPSQWWQLARCYLNGPVRRALPALGLMGMVAFQEFELAALLQTASWTDWFIRAQQVGLDSSQMIRSAIGLVSIQLPLLIVAIFWFARTCAVAAEHHEVVPQPLLRWTRTVAIVYLGCAMILGDLIPLCVMAWNLPDGVKLILRQPAQLSGLCHEILVAVAISVLAGTTAWFIGSGWKRNSRPGAFGAVFRSALLLPGLTGSLLLSLVAVVVFQQPWLRPLYDTPIPWVLALIVWLLPRALLLRLWVGLITETESVHLAQMLVVDSSSKNDGPTLLPESEHSSNVPFARRFRRTRVLLFRSRDQPQLLAIGLLCYWAYLDLSTAFLLAPSGLQSGLVRLYNFMHFGRSSALSAEAFLFFGAPLLATFLAVQLVRAIEKLRARWTS